MNDIPEFNFHGEPLSKEDCMKFTSLLLEKDKEKPLLDNEGLREEFPAKIFLTRIEGYGLPFTVSDFFFLMSVITFADSPGKIMGLLWLCHSYYKKTKKSLLGINDWAEMFPWGAPTDDEFSSWWDSQKCPGIRDNLVDYPELWKL